MSDIKIYYLISKCQQISPSILLKMSLYNIKVTLPVDEPRVITFSNTPTQNQPQKLFKSFTISPEENPNTKQFAFQLLQAELQLEQGENINQSLVTKLFQLYRLGIEYYNQQKSKKQSFFQKKLQSLTNNPVVLGALHDSDNGSDSFYKKKQIEKLVQIDQKKLLPAKEIINQIFNREKTVESQLKNQSWLIQKRVNDRKLSKKSCQGDSSTDGREDLLQPIVKKKKLNKTVIVKSTNPEDQDLSKYFVNGAVICHDV